MDNGTQEKVKIDPAIPFEPLDEPVLNQRTPGRDLRNAPQNAMTASDGTLPNAIIRIGELETALKNLGLLR